MMLVHNLDNELVEVNEYRIKGIKDAAQRYNACDFKKWRFTLYLDLDRNSVQVEEIYGFNSWNVHKNPNYIKVPLGPIPEACKRQEESIHKGELDKRKTVSWFKYCISHTLAALKRSLNDYRDLGTIAEYGE